MSRRHRGKLAPFIAMDRHQHKSAAFAALSAVAQALLVHLTYNYNTKMMNSVYLSARDGAKKLNMSKNTAARALLELEHYGFIVKLTGAYLGVSGVGKSAHYRLTAQRYGNLGATRDYDKWTGEIFSPKKQNPVPPQGQCVPPQVHKGRAGKPPKMEQVSHHRYIGAVTDCPTTGTYLVSPDTAGSRSAPHSAVASKPGAEQPSTPLAECLQGAAMPKPIRVSDELAQQHRDRGWK
jgi:hypothetical protein